MGAGTCKGTSQAGAQIPSRRQPAPVFREGTVNTRTTVAWRSAPGGHQTFARRVLIIFQQFSHLGSEALFPVPLGHLLER
jgi:hypothetical protein